MDGANRGSSRCLKPRGRAWRGPGSRQPGDRGGLRRGSSGRRGDRGSAQLRWCWRAHLAQPVGDGLDGAVAADRGHTDLGGYLDIVLDLPVLRRRCRPASSLLSPPRTPWPARLIFLVLRQRRQFPRLCASRPSAASRQQRGPKACSLRPGLPRPARRSRCSLASACGRHWFAAGLRLRRALASTPRWRVSCSRCAISRAIPAESGNGFPSANGEDTRTFSGTADFEESRAALSLD